MSGHEHNKQGVALISVAASAVLTLAKLTVGVMSGSLAVLAEAGHSFLDFCATLMTYFAVRAADRPADDDHHYGHGKIESLAALGETALLFLLSGMVIVEGVKRLFGEPHVVPVTPIMIAVLVLSIVIDFWRARALSATAKATHSDALAADALHFYSDMLGSFMALLGLVAVWLGYAKGDAVAAIMVALFICVLGWKLGRRTVDNLLDVAPAGLAETLRKAAIAVPGVVRVTDVRLRMAGPEVFGEVMMQVSRTLAFDRVMEIKTRVQQAATALEPRLKLVVTADAVALDDETIMERVHLTARAKAQAIHHVSVHQIGDTIAVGFDIEVDGNMPLAQAHVLASELEDAVRADLGPDCEVEAHIEPLQMSTLYGTPSDEATVKAVTEFLMRASASTLIVDVHNVRVRGTREGLVVHFHCRAHKATPVNRVHEAVDSIEQALRNHRIDILRVVSHAEPIRE